MSFAGDNKPVIEVIPSARVQLDCIVVLPKKAAIAKDIGDTYGTP